MKKNLEDIFKVLQDYSEEAPDLMAAIHAKRSAPLYRFKNHLKRNVLKYAAALVLLLSVSLFFFRNSNDSDQSQENPIAQEQVRPAENDSHIQSDQEIPQLNNTEAENGSDKNTNSTQIKSTTVKPNSTIDQANSKPIGPNQEPLNEQNAGPGTTNPDQHLVHTDEGINSGDRRTNEDVVIPTPTVPDSPVVVENGDNQNVETPIHPPVVEDSPKTEESPEKPVIDENPKTEAPIVEDAPSNDANEDVKDDADSVLSEVPVVQTLPDTSSDQAIVKPVPDGSNPNGRWSMQGMFGYGYMNNQIISNNEASEIRKNSETPLGSYQAAVLANYRLNDILDLQFGLNYASFKSQVDYTHNYELTHMNVSSQDVIIFDYPGSPGRKVTLHDTTYTTEEKSEELKSSNLVHSFQVPLNIKYNWDFTKVVVYFKAGMNLEVASIMEGKVLNEQFGWTNLNTDAYIRRKFMGSYQFGLGGSYLISNRTALVAELQSQRTPDSIWKTGNGVREIQFNNNVKIGLQFHF